MLQALEQRTTLPYPVSSPDSGPHQENRASPSSSIPVDITPGQPGRRDGHETIVFKGTNKGEINPEKTTPIAEAKQNAGKKKPPQNGGELSRRDALYIFSLLGISIAAAPFLRKSKLVQNTPEAITPNYGVITAHIIYREQANKPPQPIIELSLIPGTTRADVNYATFNYAIGEIMKKSETEGIFHPVTYQASPYPHMSNWQAVFSYACWEELKYLLPQEPSLSLIWETLQYRSYPLFEPFCRFPPAQAGEAEAKKHFYTLLKKPNVSNESLVLAAFIIGALAKNFSQT
jgi:hypothetical protein